MSELLPRLTPASTALDSRTVDPTTGSGTGSGGPAVALLDLNAVRQAAGRRLWVVLLASVMGLSIAGWLVWRATPTYTATATIRMADSRRALAGALVDKSSDDGAAETDPVLTEMQVLLSRSVAGRVATGPLGATLRVRPLELPPRAVTIVAVDSTAPSDSIALGFGANGVTARSGNRVAHAAYGMPLSISGVTFIIPSRPAVASAALRVQSLDETVQRLVRGTSAVRRPGTNIVDVTYRGSIPEVVQQSANSVALAFQQVNRENAMQKSLQRREFLGQRVAQTDSLLQLARDSLSAFQSSRQLGAARLVAGATGAEASMPADAGGARESRVAAEARLQAQRVLVTRLERAAPEGDGAAIRVALASAPAGTVTPLVAQLADRVGMLRSARDSLTFGRWARAATHPDVVRLDTLLRSAATELVAAAQAQLDPLEDQLRQASVAARREQRALADLPRLQVEEQSLIERTAMYERLAQQLREEYQRAQIEEAAESGDIQLVDSAVQPRTTDGIPAAQQLLFGLLLGLVVGVALAYLLEQLDTTLHGEEELEQQIGVTSLGTVPSFSAAARAGRPHFMRLRNRRRAVTRRRMPSIVRRENSPADAAWAPGDAFRSLYTNILFADPRGVPRSLVVTSAVAGEGKSTIAVNLAICMAQHGGRILLMDGDQHRPQLHAAFGLPRENGLTELVRDGHQWGDVVHPTEFGGLFVLTAGRSMGREPGLLRSIAVRHALAELKQSFDVVIIDGPPVLYTADAAMISAVAEGVIVVASVGLTDRTDCRTAVRMLRQVGAQILGAVLNDPDANLQNHHYERYGYHVDTRALASRT